MNWQMNPMVENEKLSDQFNLFTDQTINPRQTNLFPSYNSNINTSNNNGPTSNISAWDQQYFQPSAPMNNFATDTPTTENYHPFMIPSESFPLQHDKNSYVPLQEPGNFNNASGGNLLDPNWDAIGAFLAGHVRPGADVTHVYRCVVCNVEFANPQALGGHMTAHSKKRKNKNKGESRSNKSKKIKKTKSKNVKKNKSFKKNVPH